MVTVVTVQCCDATHRSAICRPGVSRARVRGSDIRALTIYNSSCLLHLCCHQIIGLKFLAAKKTFVPRMWLDGVGGWEISALENMKASTRQLPSKVVCLKLFSIFFLNCASLQLGEVIYLNQGFSMVFFFIVVIVNNFNKSNHGME